MIHRSFWLILALSISFGTALVEYLTAGRLFVVIPYAVIIPLIVLMPRFLYYYYALPRGRGSTRLLINIERALFIIVGLNAPASLLLHNLGFQYDRFLHFTMGIAYFYAFILLISIFFKNPGMLMHGIPFVTLIIAGIAMTFLWEGGQYTLDRIFGISLFSDRAQDITRDFWEDVFFGIAGGIISLAYLKNRLMRIVMDI
ncbi:MAG: hypothetical protein COW88_03290 [Candidatus Lloydbacteria bacterium CG22_combo_CG10-13_8_21_14_all_47_15]|uniref:DUF2238 domain-containing protein n=1 Tax=Candidatus Lloydbacteria bacterium CG22_combo_CG10-13_8_21_14_all_47_15 TaxID=1974635 RepID=A0A2H0CUD7_9BACT|nr:MAG: hypothetical protein COW88_03290 [Candidatus Lloydbacteria bacterium CG22_combo_CG10-13_8_21_14_all_47_15]